MDPDAKKRETYVAHIHALIDASAMLGVNMVTTFLGRDPKKTVEENLELVKEVWPPIIAHAEEKGVKIAIENCPMLFTKDEWPGGQNLMTTPSNWRKVFAILDSPNFGINYDPSHFVWQQIDYIRPLYEFKDKIFHVHYKDIKIFRDKLDDVGIMAYPLEYMSPKLPGLGDIDWGKYVSALTDIGYDGNSVIEVEDKAFEGSLDDAKRAVRLNLEEINRRRGDGIHWDDCGGDSDETFAKRVRETYKQIYDERKDGERILIVSHGAAWLWMQRILLGVDSAAFGSYR